MSKDTYETYNNQVKYIYQALENAKNNGHNFKNFNVQEVVDDLQRFDSEIENMSQEDVYNIVKFAILRK